MSDFYQNKIHYPMMNAAIGNPESLRLRRELLADVRGSVLEIGLGSGLNLDQYPDTLESLVAVDSNPGSRPAPGRRIAVHFEVMSAEALRFADGAFDTVVSTFTLCSVTDVRQALCEIRRVLKPGGRFLFLEHGRAWQPANAVLQNLANPFYNVLACGCNVNRDVSSEIGASLSIKSLERIRIPLAPISGFYYRGMALRPLAAEVASSHKNTTSTEQEQQRI